MFDKPSPFEGIRPLSFAAIAAIFFFISLEGAMWTMFYAVYTETIGLMNETYLSELPVIGVIFSAIDPDANASHIVSMLLATFSVGTPIFIWSEIYRQKILDNPQEWFSHPQNQIIATFAGLILILVIGLEVINLYTLVAREIMPGGFVAQTDQSGVMAFLAENKGLAIGVSAVIAVINIILALFTTRAFRSLKS
ncbi:MAG: hypothetical protein ACH255_19945 [Candidatus Thiodiazotropha sp.]